MIRLDFETDVATGEPVVLTYRPPGEPIQVATGRERMAEVFARACRDGFAAHNAPFDADTGARLIGAAPVWEAFERGRVVDTQTGAVLRDVRIEGEAHVKGYALDDVCERLGAAVSPDKSNPWRMRYGELAGVPIERWPIEAITYLRDDVVAVDQILPIVEREAGLARESAHAWWLYHPGRIGVRTDAPRVAALAERVNRECAEARAACGAIFRPDGTRDTKALHRAAELAGVTSRTAPTSRFPGGQLQVTQETIEGIDDPILDAYGRWLTLNAHRTRLLPQLERERLTCRYKMAVTTRAIASGTGKKPNVVGTNIQNLPKVGGWRECLIPDQDDHVFIVADFTGLELVTFAEILDETIGGSALADALRHGIDGHITMAARLAGCSREAMWRAYRGELGAEARAFAKATRQRAKGPNFGLPGGLGVGGLIAYLRGYGQRVTEQESRRLIEAWHASDPTFARYLEQAQIRSRMGDPIVGLRCGTVRTSTRYTEHANDPFQRLGAYVSKLAGFQLARECADPSSRSVLAGARMAIFAHDEFVISCPRSRATEGAARVREVCHAVSSEILRHVPLHADPLLVNRWSKAAEPTYAPDGSLIVTEVP